MESIIKNAKLYFSEVIADDYQIIRERVEKMPLYYFFIQQRKANENYPEYLLYIDMAIEYLYLKSAIDSKPRTFMDSYARVAFITETKIRMMRLDMALYEKWMATEGDEDAEA